MAAPSTIQKNSKCYHSFRSLPAYIPLANCWWKMKATVMAMKFLHASWFDNSSCFPKVAAFDLQIVSYAQLAVAAPTCWVQQH
jgi:hypothetical protein